MCVILCFVDWRPLLAGLTIILPLHILCSWGNHFVFGLLCIVSKVFYLLQFLCSPSFCYCIKHINHVVLQNLIRDFLIKLLKLILIETIKYGQNNVFILAVFKRTFWAKGRLKQLRPQQMKQKRLQRMTSCSNFLLHLNLCSRLSSFSSWVSSSSSFCPHPLV